MPGAQNLTGYDTLFTLWLMHPDSLSCDGKPIADRVIVMLDEVHKLTIRQRRKLLAVLVESRAPTKVWMAERLEALGIDNLRPEGTKEGRDLNCIYLESYWRDNRRQFEIFAQNVADKRAESASDEQIESFAGCLQESFDEGELQSLTPNSLTTLIERVKFGANSRHEFRQWIAAKDSSTGALSDRLIGWRALEILIARETQGRLFSEELTLDSLHAKEGADVRAAAELALHREFKIPYYYGFSRMCSMASANIEQFLDLAGHVFEQIISTLLMSPYGMRTVRIGAEDQERILKLAAERIWKEIVRRVSNASEVRKFLDAVSEFCQWETYRATAPYSPGVTGIAISMEDRDKLSDPEFLAKNKEYERLARILATCVSNNVFEPIEDYKVKGGRWYVLYLNRLFCLRFDLPLQYGGFREKSIKQLYAWLEEGFHPPRRARGELLKKMNSGGA